jgi:hypothetical protein
MMRAAELGVLLQRVEVVVDSESDDRGIVPIEDRFNNLYELTPVEVLPYTAPAASWASTSAMNSGGHSVTTPPSRCAL